MRARAGRGKPGILVCVYSAVQCCAPHVRLCAGPRFQGDSVRAHFDLLIVVVLLLVVGWCRLFLLPTAAGGGSCSTFESRPQPTACTLGPCSGYVRSSKPSAWVRVLARLLGVQVRAGVGLSIAGSTATLPTTTATSTSPASHAIHCFPSPTAQVSVLDENMDGVADGPADQVGQQHHRHRDMPACLSGLPACLAYLSVWPACLHSHWPLP